MQQNIKTANFKKIIVALSHIGLFGDHNIVHRPYRCIPQSSSPRSYMVRRFNTPLTANDRAYLDKKQRWFAIQMLNSTPLTSYLYCQAELGWQSLSSVYDTRQLCFLNRVKNLDNTHLSFTILQQGLRDHIHNDNSKPMIFLEDVIRVSTNLNPDIIQSVMSFQPMDKDYWKENITQNTESLDKKSMREKLLAKVQQDGGYFWYHNKRDWSPKVALTGHAEMG